MSRPHLVVEEPGLHGSIQDLGRPGLQGQGVSAGGALDPRALHEAAALLGQSPELAALEMTLTGGRFRAQSGPVRVALTGASLDARVDGEPVAWRSAFTLADGQILDIGKAKAGVYGYLSLGGGIDVPEVLGSRSTHLRAGFGGLEGRPIRKGDQLVAGNPGEAAPPAVLDVEVAPPPDVVRVLWGVHASEFDPSMRDRFLETTFKVSAKRDRMGVRLEGASAPFTPERGLTLISDAVVLGDIQIPGDGEPIVLLADRQPTGGYPRLATVISADIAAFAQLPTSRPVRFRAVHADEAKAALATMRAELLDLPKRVSVRRVVDELGAVNLIDGVYAGAPD